MSDTISRRLFTSLGAGLVISSASDALAGGQSTAEVGPQPIERAFARDYPAPGFKPTWKKAQINRSLVQDFVIYAHSELDMVKKLLDKEPMLLHAAIDWGGGDWETGLGGASHMGRHDIAGFLLKRGARIDIFCAAMMGLLEAVKVLLVFQPKLIDAKGPHGFSLHFHAQVGGTNSESVLDYLQTVKRIEMKPNPFLKKSESPAK
jgi:hypothetical protein